MSLAWVEWQAICPATWSVPLVEASLAWLVDSPEAVSVDRTNAWHGAPLAIVVARVERSRAAREALAKLGPDQLVRVAAGLTPDGAGIVHLRVGLAAAAAGRAELVDPGTRCEVAKGRVRIAVHGGNDPVTVWQAVVADATELAERHGAARSSSATD